MKHLLRTELSLNYAWNYCCSAMDPEDSGNEFQAIGSVTSFLRCVTYDVIYW